MSLGCHQSGNFGQSLSHVTLPWQFFPNRFSLLNELHLIVILSNGKLYVCFAFELSCHGIFYMAFCIASLL